MDKINTIKQVLIAFSLVLLGGCQLADMAQFVYANANAVHSWEGEVKTTSLPFELVDDHIVLPVAVNGSEPLDFVLDSGAAASLILESHNTRKLPLELGAELTVSGVGTGEDPVARIIADTSLSIGSARVEGLSLIYLAQSEVPFFDNLDEVYFDGVIGAPVFERFVVEIDYDRQLIHFSEPGSVSAMYTQAQEGWQELPLEIASGVPYLATQVVASTGSLTDVKLLVDTGFRGSLSLTPSTHEGITLPLQTFSTVGHGLSGEVRIEVGKTPLFHLGRLALHDLPVSYSTAGGESDNDSNGIIGNQVLQRFNMVFDYPNQRMLIKPGARYAEPILVDRSGLLVRPHRLGAVVKSVAPGSVAGQHDLQVADIITRFEDKPVQRTNIMRLKQLLASQRDSVSLCWQSQGKEEEHCGEVALASRFTSQPAGSTGG
jgi:predicted aspartyl protease